MPHLLFIDINKHHPTLSISKSVTVWSESRSFCETQLFINTLILHEVMQWNCMCVSKCPQKSIIHKTASYVVASRRLFSFITKLRRLLHRSHPYPWKVLPHRNLNLYPFLEVLCAKFRNLYLNIRLSYSIFKRLK